MAKRSQNRQPEIDPAVVDPLSPFLGPRLRIAREEKMKQEAMAQRLGMSDKTLRNMETGQSPVTLQALADICQILKRNPDEILLQAIEALWEEVVGRLGTSADGPVAWMRKRLLAALEERQRAELREAETRLTWDAFLVCHQELRPAEPGAEEATPESSGTGGGARSARGKAARGRPAPPSY